jgi:NAD(P)-dependent dehydrogenase (short-subunit alcohol dehydrogenase family)
MPEEKPLAGRVALVTGASRGIGLAIARRVGRMGARVAICGRDRMAVDRAARGLNEERVEALGVAADVASSRDVAAMVARVNERFGEIEILVNNAGVGAFAPVHELSQEDWDRVIGTNLTGVFLVTRAVAPQMIRRRSGHVINISSLAGKNAFAGAAAYCASKWGLQGLTYCMAEDLRGYGIRVSVICPGTVQTEFSPHAGKDPKKMLQPDDVAHAVAMLLTQAPQSFISEVLLRPTQKP